MSIKKIMTMGFAFVLSNISTAAEDLKDPLLRDESIAGVSIESRASRLPSGNWEYVYSISNPASSKGTIVEVRIDQSHCFNADEMAEQYQLVEPAPELPADDPHNYTRRPRAFVPMYVYPVPGKTSVPKFSHGSDLILQMWLKPGESVEGLRMISIAGPTKRSYLVSPAWSSYGWDYARYFGTQTTLPEQKNFRVEGLVTAPGCEREGTMPERYPGAYRNESEGVNQLLTYATPDRDQILIPADAKTIDIHVYYSDAIDEESFHVQPGSVKNLFNPIPGGDQVVSVPVRPHRLTLSLEASSQKDKDVRKDDDLDHSYKDRDTFVIVREQ